MPLVVVLMALVWAALWVVSIKHVWLSKSDFCARYRGGLRLSATCYCVIGAIGISQMDMFPGVPATAQFLVLSALAFPLSLFWAYFVYKALDHVRMRDLFK